MLDGAKQMAVPSAIAEAVLEADGTPLRLPLGNDAADAVDAALTGAREEFAAWEPVSRGTDFYE
ncbi:hypothetical protein [Actinomadura luteofluorescens]|uniref:hypothetical protein n=1 Tax=Actinomadura luteofluorescens TaxID=46163 RepID=UPI0030D0BAEA